jgi:undecaprenyl-diphosphatase
VVVFARREIRAMLTTRPRLLLVTIVATIPVGVIGLLAKDLVKDLAQNMFVVGGCLLFTGALLGYVRRRDTGTTEAAALPLWKAAAVGVAQGIAILPGVSRSGSTLAAGLRAGLDREHAVRFSFLLAAPAIAGAGLLMILKGGFNHGNRPGPLLAGTLVSFAASLLAMKVMVGVVARRRLGWFSLYCLAAGLFAIVLGWHG